MEWVDGIKLTDEIRLSEAFLNRRELIDQVKGQNYSLSHALAVCKDDISILCHYLTYVEMCP